MQRNIRKPRALAPKPRALAPLAALALLACALPAQADQAWGNVESISPQRIEVLSNGASYTTTAIPLVSLGASVTLHIDPGVSGRVKSWSAWLTARAEGNGVLVQFSNDKIGKSYALTERPKDASTRASITLPFGSIGSYAIAQCNAMAGRLRGQGMADAAIFAQERVVTATIDTRVEAEFSGVSGAYGAPSEVQYARPTLDIVCKSHTPPPKPGTTSGGTPPVGVGPALLQQVTMIVQHPPSPTPVQCPVEVTAFMTFKAQGKNAQGQELPPGHFSYRVRSLSGKVSRTDQIFLQESDRSGPYFVKTLTQKFMVGVPGTAQPQGVGVGPLGQQAAGGLMAGGSGGGGSGLAGSAMGSYATGGAPTPPNVHKDSLWIDIEGAKAGSVLKSDYSAYSVTCQPSTAIGGGPGAVQARPDPQRPGATVPGGLSGGPQVPTPVAPQQPQVPAGQQQQQPQLPSPPPVPRPPMGESTGAAPGAGANLPSVGKAVPPPMPVTPLAPARPAGVSSGAAGNLAPAARKAAP